MAEGPGNVKKKGYIGANKKGLVWRPQSAILATHAGMQNRERRKKANRHSHCEIGETNEII